MFLSIVKMGLEACSLTFAATIVVNTERSSPMTGLYSAKATLTIGGLSALVAHLTASGLLASSQPGKPAFSNDHVASHGGTARSPFKSRSVRPD